MDQRLRASRVVGGEGVSKLVSVARYLAIVLSARRSRSTASACDEGGVGGISGAEGEWIGY